MNEKKMHIENERLQINNKALTPTYKFDSYEMKYFFVRTNLRTTNLKYSSLYTQSKSIFGHIRDSNSKR